VSAYVAEGDCKRRSAGRKHVATERGRRRGIASGLAGVRTNAGPKWPPGARLASRRPCVPCARTSRAGSLRIAAVASRVAQMSRPVWACCYCRPTGPSLPRRRHIEAPRSGDEASTRARWPPLESLAGDRSRECPRPQGKRLIIIALPVERLLHRHTEPGDLYPEIASAAKCQRCRICRACQRLSFVCKHLFPPRPRPSGPRRQLPARAQRILSTRLSHLLLCHPVSVLLLSSSSSWHQPLHRRLAKGWKLSLSGVAASGLAPCPLSAPSSSRPHMLCSSPNKVQASEPSQSHLWLSSSFPLLLLGRTTLFRPGLIAAAVLVAILTASGPFARAARLHSARMLQCY
jgi:hypothetical protein